MKIMNEDVWRDLECLHKACRQLWQMESYSQTLALMNEVKMNDNNENDNEMRNVSQVKRSENWQKYVQQTMVEMIGERGAITRRGWQVWLDWDQICEKRNRNV